MFTIKSWEKIRRMAAFRSIVSASKLSTCVRPDMQGFSTTRQTQRSILVQPHSSSAGALSWHRLLSNDNKPNAKTEFVPESTGNDLPLADGYLPPPPSAPGLNEELTSLGEPALSSLGLGGYWPTGWVQSLLESIHVTADVPWYTSVIILTLCLRSLTIPLSIIQLRNTALLHNHMPTLQKLQTAHKEAVMAGDHGRAEKAGKEVFDYMTRNNVNPLKMVTRPLVMVPIFMSVFWGIRGMTDLPVQSMTTGGGLWFADLTIADPLYILPALSAFSVWLVMKTGAEGSSMSSMPPAMRVVFSVLPFGIFAFTSFQPAALALYWTTSNVISLIFGKVFRMESMRARFNIPEMIDHPKTQTSQSESTESFTSSMNTYRKMQELMHEVEDRRKVDAVKFSQSDPVKAWQEHKPKQINIGSASTDNEQSEVNKSTPISEYDPSKPRLTREQFKSTTHDTTNRDKNSTQD